MIAILNIFLKSGKTFDYLDEQYEEDLDTRCIYIFGIFGFINGLESHLAVTSDIAERFGDKMLILSTILYALIGASIGVLLGRYVLSYIVIGLSRLLRGEGEKIDLRVVTAYSLIPLMIKGLILIYYWITGKYSMLSDMEFWIIATLLFLTWIFSIKILLVGLMRFNKFGLIKSLFVTAPYILYFGFQTGLVLSTIIFRAANKM